VYPNCVPSPVFWQFASLLCCRNEYKCEADGYSAGSKDMNYVAAVWYPLWYACIEEWKTQTTVFPSHRNMRMYISSYQPLLRSSDSTCWRIELTCPNLRTVCSCFVRLSTVRSKRHRSSGDKLPSAVSSNFKRFHIYKKHKFIPGIHWMSVDENVRLTLRWLMSYIYGAPILDVSRSHTTTQHSR